jgi:glycosyltransferase involved in cell wall biosynthesis
MKNSIIISTAGRPVAVRSAIQSLLALSLDRHETEILVIDNNSQEDFAQDLYGYCIALNGQVRYIRETNPGLSAARHRSIRESLGSILTFVENDVEVCSGWFDAIQAGFDDPEVGMIGGPSIPSFTGTMPAWLWDFVDPTPYGGWMCGWLSLLDIGQDVKNINPNYIWGLNFSIRKDVITRCGGFHPDLVPSDLQRWQGDGETGLTRKVIAAGYRADYLQEALVHHLCSPDRLTPQSFAKRAYYQGICNSFTSIRAGKDPVPGSTHDMEPSGYRKMRRLAGKALRQALGCDSRWAKDCAPIRAVTEQAYLEGWRFHQSEVAADPKLLAWVRREDYWDADIRNEMT